MTSYRVNTPTISISIFDVVGKDGGDPGFVIHAGLAKSAGKHGATKIPVLEMGPPLHGHGCSGHIEGDVLGRADLTDDEAHKIRTFVDRHENEHLVFRQVNSRRLLIQSLEKLYCVHPHALPFSEDDGRYARMRFSCAGFVYEAYKRARINLLDISKLPPVGIALIRSSYSGLLDLIENAGISPEVLGLKGEESLPVLLCGYLFHALNRDAGTIRKEPYVPDIEDRCFT